MKILTLKASTNPYMLQFECDECGKHVDDKWKLEAHKKNHKKFECDQCSKVFKFKETREKHIKIAHENVKLFCHYFNNDKVCPYKEECIFLHEDSNACRYGLSCERNNCMFKQCTNEEIADSENEKDVENGKDVEVENDDATEKIEIVSIDITDADADESMNNNYDKQNETFMNPSQADTIASVMKFKCEKCDFETSSGLEIKNHKQLFHTLCSSCFSNFSSPKQLKKHIKNILEKKK